MPSGSLGSLTVDLVANVARFERALNKAERLAEKRANNMRRTFTRLATGISGAFASFQLVRQVEQAIEFADSIGKTADKLGVATDALQEFRFAAEQTGVAQAALDVGLQRFTRRVGEAAQGEGVLKDVLSDLNIELRDTNGNLRDTEDILKDYADAIKNAESEQEQLRLTFKAFDTEGVALVNLLRQGGDAISAYQLEARQLGIVLEEDVIRGAERASDAMNRVTRIIQIGATRTFAQLAPHIEDMANAFRDFATGEVQNLPEFMQNLLKDFAQFDFLVERVTQGLGFLGAAAALLVSGEFAALKELWQANTEATANARAELDEYLASFDRVQSATGGLSGGPGEGGTAGAGVSSSLNEFSDARKAEIESELEFTEDILQQATRAHDRHMREREKLERNFASRKQSIERGILQNTLSLFSILGRESRGFAIASIIFEKGVAIAQATINTAVAVTKALSIDPTGALAARTALLGKIQIGLIAATGIAQASQISSGGAGGAALGAPSNPISTAEAPLPFENTSPAASGGTITINVNGVVTDEIVNDLIVPAIQDSIDNKDVILFRNDSRQALELGI